MKDKEFIDTLFPPIPIYVCMLPVAVQEELGKAGAESQGAVRLLEKVGLRFLRHIDPFDSGTYYGAKVKDLIPVQQLRHYELAAESSPTIETSHQDMLIGWESEQGFRAATVTVQPAGAHLYCAATTLASLNLRDGVTIAAMPFA